MPKSNFLPSPDPIVVLVGPTAIGKTALSIALAQEFDLEIVGVDSMQVYRYLDIGTAKIRKDEMAGIPHHLIDVVDPDAPFDAGIYEHMALTVIKGIQERGKGVLLTGGTGLYLNAILNGLSAKIGTFPEIRKELERQVRQGGCHVLHEQLRQVDGISATRIHPNDSHRVVRALEIFRGTGRPWAAFIAEHREAQKIRFPNTLLIGLTCERERLYRRIDKRSEMMLENGLEGEVLGLLERGYQGELQSMQSIGYSHMLKYLAGEWDYGTLLQRLQRDTRRYAKRQYTWFNKVEEMCWLESGHQDQAREHLYRFLHDSPGKGHLAHLAPKEKATDQ